ncbi:ABC transporter ATP-binding protein [Patescibacteria group bacterium]
MEVVKVTHVSKIYDEGKPNETRALNDVSLSIKKGEFTAIMGVSGSGKSTLMHIVGCLDIPTRGSYQLEGEDISKKSQGELVTIRRKKIGFVFQTFNLLPRISSLANVELPLIYNGMPAKQRRQRAHEVLEQVGLTGRMSHSSSELSGGQQQRVAIARAIVHNPAIVLADEPTGNLDSKSGNEIMDILEQLNAQGATIILVTHDMTIAKRSHRIVNMVDGRIV